MFEINIFHERLDGELGHVIRKWKAKTPEELLKKWFMHLDYYEGSYYEVLDDKIIITDGVYDPDDYLIIGEWLGYSDDEIDRIYDKYIVLTSYGNK